jgi:small GTP-binding protein
MKPLGLQDSKVILVGNESVGKTSILEQYTSHVFNEGTDPTIGASFVLKNIETRSGLVQIHIWDTAGQERYRSLIPMYSRNAVAAIIVVDVTNRESWEKVGMWLSIVQGNFSPDCRFYLVANKVDLEILVAIDDLEQWAETQQFPFFKTSARDLTSVSAVFEKVAEDIVEFSKTSPELMNGPSRLPSGSEKKGCCH